MNGANPCPPPTAPRLPARPYVLRITDADGRTHEITVDPARIPYSRHGRPGSILDIALAHDIEIGHACGGVCACATCHVLIQAGLDSCNPATDAEEDRLDAAPGVTPRSRLACQCVPDGTQTVVAVVPAWNRNLARERG